jgi:hypothetical protein
VADLGRAGGRVWCPRCGEAVVLPLGADAPAPPPRRVGPASDDPLDLPDDDLDAPAPVGHVEAVRGAPLSYEAATAMADITLSDAPIWRGDASRAGTAAEPPAIALAQDGRTFSLDGVETLRRWIAEGRIDADAEVSERGGPWQPLRQRSDLAGPWLDPLDPMGAASTWAPLSGGPSPLSADVDTGDEIDHTVESNVPATVEMPWRSVAADLDDALAAADGRPGAPPTLAAGLKPSAHRDLDEAASTEAAPPRWRRWVEPALASLILLGLAWIYLHALAPAAR